MKTLFLFCLLFLTTLSSFAQDEILRGKLSNGLSYYIMKNSKPENRASLNLAVKSGSLNETEDQRGLAHFLEHMAFNGTARYPKNDLVKYLQSLGLSFGGDLNAHTGYDETVYKLQIPTDSEKSLTEGFQVLRQWATDITLDSRDIEEEKNIIMEEWRTAQGLTERLGKIRREALFGDSRFFQRSPIGVPETIQGANQKLLKDYYENWYHPELMAVIAVGDFDPEKVKAIIEKEFSFSPKKPLSSQKEYSLPETVGGIKVFSDPELTASTLDIFSKGEYLPGNSEKNHLENLKYLIFSNILNSRLSILEKRKDTGFSKAFHYWYPLGKNTSVQGLKITSKENRIPDSLKEIMENLQSLALYPVSQDELLREIEELSAYLKNRETNRASVENESFIEEIRDEFTLGDNFLSPQESSLLFQKLKDKVTPQEIQKIARNFYEENFSILAYFPQKEGVIPVNEKELEKVFQEVKSSPGKNLFSENMGKFQAAKLKPGKILHQKDLGEYTFFQLSNGIDVFYKETDFDKDRINMLLFREEGSSVLDHKGYLNSLFLGELLEKSGAGGLNKEEYELFLKGKNYSISSYVSDYDQGFNLYSDKENLPLALDNLTTLLTEGKLDSDLLQNKLALSREKWNNLKNSPRMVFSEKMRSSISGDNPRRRTPNLEDLSLVTMEGVEEVNQKLFKDFSGYKLILTGSLDSEKMRDILINYISALPGSSEKRKNFSPGNLEIKQPLSSIRETISQGQDAKATVYIYYPYQDIYSNRNRILLSAYSKILDIVLIEKIREEMAGVYSIRSSDSLRYENHGENSLRVNYTSSPDSALKISQAVQEIIKESLEGKYIQENLEKIYENYRLTYQDETKRNRFWFYYLKNRALKNRDYSVPTPEEYKNLVTYEALVEFLPRALSPNIFIEGVLLPENKEIL